MNRDEMEGKWDQTKGKVKENVGRALNDRDMEQMQKKLNSQSVGRGKLMLLSFLAIT